MSSVRQGLGLPRAFSTSEALLGGFAIGSLFVGSLYALGNRRLIACHWNRNHPQVIMDRIRAVLVTCVVVAALLCWLFFRRGVLTSARAATGNNNNNNNEVTNYFV
jgi:hypothetical protein